MYTNIYTKIMDLVRTTYNLEWKEIIDKVTFHGP
jgi:hypothetical protein